MYVWWHLQERPEIFATIRKDVLSFGEYLLYEGMHASVKTIHMTIHFHTPVWRHILSFWLSCRRGTPFIDMLTGFKLQF